MSLISDFSSDISNLKLFFEVMQSV